MRDNDVLILAGSLRRESVSRVAGEILHRNLSASGISTGIISMTELDLPFFNPDIHYDHAPFAQGYLDAVRRCRAMIWCAPSYHRTISGSFKNAIDFLELLLDDKPCYLTGKFVAAVSTSTGIVSSANATAEMAMAAQALRAFAFPLLIPIPATQNILDSEGNIKDKRICRKLDELAAEIRNFILTGVPYIAETTEAR